MASLALIGMMNPMLIILLIQLSEQQQEFPCPRIFPCPEPARAGVTKLQIMEGTNFTFQGKMDLRENIWDLYTNLRILYTWEVKLDQDLGTDKFTPIWKTSFDQQQVTHHAAEGQYWLKVMSSKNDIPSLMSSSFISLLNVEMSDPLLTHTSTQLDLRCSVKYWYNGTKWHVDGGFPFSPLSIVKSSNIKDMEIVGKPTISILDSREESFQLYPPNNPIDLNISPGHTHTFTILYDLRQMDGVTVTWKLYIHNSAEAVWVVKYENRQKIVDKSFSVKLMVKGSDSTPDSILITHSLSFINIVNVPENDGKMTIYCEVNFIIFEMDSTSRTQNLIMHVVGFPNEDQSEITSTTTKRTFTKATIPAEEPVNTAKATLVSTQGARHGAQGDATFKSAKAALASGIAALMVAVACSVIVMITVRRKKAADETKALSKALW